MKKASNTAVARGLIWQLFEKFGAEAIVLLISIVLARLLDPVVYGTVALVTVIINLLRVFVNSGLGTALVQKQGADDTDFSTVFYFNVVACIVLYVGLFFFAPLIAQFYDNPELTEIIRVLGLTLIVAGVRNIQQSYVSKHLLFRKSFISTIIGLIISAIVGIIMACYGFGVWALVAQHLVQSAACTLILWITVKWRPKLLFSFKRLKGLFSYGWKLLVSSLIDVGYRDVRQLIIGKMYLESDLAFYNKGDQFPNIASTSITASIDSVLLPVMSESQKDVVAVKNMTRRAIKVGSFIIWPMMIGLAACGQAFISVLLGEKWLPSVPFLQIFCFVYAFYPIHTANLNAIKAMGRSDLFLTLEIIKKVVGIAILIAAMWFGPLVMAISSLVSTIISSFINAFPNKKLLNYNYFEQIKDMLPSIALSLIMGGAVWCINLIGLSDILTLVIQVPLGVIIYIVGAKLFKFDSFNYVWNLLKKLFKKEKNKSFMDLDNNLKAKPTQELLKDFLMAVDTDFSIPLSQKVDLSRFAEKLFNKAEIVAKIIDGQIISMVAGYTDNLDENGLAYISIVATIKQERGKGYCKQQLLQFLSKAKSRGAHGVHLYTTPGNIAAIKLYDSIGFEKYDVEDEPRPNDVHLIIRF